MIFLEVNGVEYTGFTEISVIRSVGSLSGSFTFSTTSKPDQPLPIEGGESCRVLIKDIPTIDGFIEDVSVSYNSKDEHIINISGRDKVADVIDSSTLIKELKGTLSLQTLIRRVLNVNGLQNIQVINNVSGLKPFSSGDIQSAEIGETVFEYIERYSKKRQVLLTGDGEGNIVITRSGVTKAQTSLLNVINGVENNILSGNASYSISQLFNKYIVRSQLNPIALTGDAPNSDIVNQSGQAIDSNIRTTRTLELNPDQSGSSNDSKQLATWTKNIRQAQSFNYTAIVQGYHQDEQQTRLWVPNEIVSIKDDFAGMKKTLDAQMLTDTVNYRLTKEGGSTTVITCVNKNAYTLQAEKDERDSRANELGI